MIFSCDLPMPPSANMMFINSPNLKGRGRFPSPAYKAWKFEAQFAVLDAYRRADRPVIGKPYSVHIELNLNHQSDICNREKAIVDLLVQTLPGFPDDCWANRVLIERNRSIPAARVEVTTLPTSIGEG
jgi:hypothetical protein